MATTTLIFGGSGLVGSALRALWEDDEDRRQLRCPSHDEVDIADLEAVRRCVGESGAALVVNAAAQADVNRAEVEPGQAFAVNAVGPHNLALAAAEAQLPLVHFSSDYVFDGRARRPYREVDPTGLPASQYGQSKLLGEQLVRQTWREHYVVRVAAVFGPGRAGPNKTFVDWVVAEADPARPLTIVNDRTVSPTYAVDLARQVDRLIQTGAYGTYHATGHGVASWFELARRALRVARKDPEGVTPVADVELPPGPPRPAYSALDNHLLGLRGLDVMRPWREALAAYLAPDEQHGDAQG